MTEASVLRLIRLLRRASVAAEPAVEALKLARLARRLAATDLATARIVAKRAERLMPRARRSVRDFVKESGVDAARGERVIVLLEREFEGARSVLKVESAMKRLASATLKDLSVDSVADEAALALREILAAEISPVYMNKLTDLLTREDWRRLVRRAAPLEPTALNTMRGLIQEAITLHLPQFQHAVREAEQLAKRLPGEWKPVISTQVMALDRAGRQLRAYVDGHLLIDDHQLQSLHALAGQERQQRRRPRPRRRPVRAGRHAARGRTAAPRRRALHGAPAAAQGVPARTELRGRARSCRAPNSCSSSR